MKNRKQMWEQIAKILREKHNGNFTGVQCENRWKVMERNYKKTKDNNKKTGRAPKFFEYEAHLDEIYIKKKNIVPVVLLSSGDAIKPSKSESSTSIKDCQNEKENQILNETSRANENFDHDYGKIKQNISSNSNTTQKKRRNAKPNVLESLRQDLRDYHKEKIKIDKQKLEQTIRRNNAIEERNRLIQRFLDANGSVPSIL